MRLHPFLHEVTEQCGNVDENHQGTGDGQRKHRCFGRTRFNDGHRFVCAYDERKCDLVVDFFKFYFLCFTFAEIGFAGAQEVTLLIAKVKDQNLLGNVHLFVVGLLRFIAVSRKASQLIVYTNQVKSRKVK